VNGNSHIRERLIREMGIKQRKNSYKRLYTKIPLNRAVSLGSFPAPVRGILTIPPWDTKLNSSGGIRSSSDQDMSPRPPPYKYHPECTSHNFSLFPINVPTNYRSWSKYDEVLTKTILQSFLEQGVKYNICPQSTN